jgi:hypothetical protein
VLSKSEFRMTAPISNASVVELVGKIRMPGLLGLVGLNGAKAT